MIRGYPTLQGSSPDRSTLKLLFLVPFAPGLDAPHGGGRVIAQLMKQLSSRYRIALCYLRTAEEPAVGKDILEACEIVEEAVIPTDGNSGRGRWLQSFRVWTQVLAGKPLWAIGRSAGAYSERIRTLIQNWSPDVIQIEYHIMGQYLPALDGCPAPRILVEHDPGRETAAEICRAHRARGVIMPYLDLFAWQRFERAVIQQVQAVVVFTERDRYALSKFGQPTPIVRVPLGADLPEQPLNPFGTEPFSLLFVGNFQHVPNVDAAVRLIDGIFPKVQSRFPESVLYIVGSHPPQEICRKANEKVIVTGFVPDVKLYLNQVALVVVPLRLGGGMRVKVLEALSAGKATVASPLATEGLDVLDGEQIVQAETDDEFSEAIIRLLLSPEQRVRIARRARIWACTHMGWEKYAAEYDALYQHLLVPSEYG